MASCRVPFKSRFNPDEYDDSRTAGLELFKMMIYPINVDMFYSDFWEKKPVVICRKCPFYNSGWFSGEDLNNIISNNKLEYGININMSCIINGDKIIKRSNGDVSLSTFMEDFNVGHSLQFVNPQLYSKSLWFLTATLQEHFSSFVGTNIYLTPAGTQGFAPHFDDIEAFVIQIEGKKRWRLYNPLSSFEVLPSYSSRDFTEDEIGQPILDVILSPGDLLYFPRGTIHQAMALPDYHSLHITLSTYQDNSYGTLLQKTLPSLLKLAIHQNEQFRLSLPHDYTSYANDLSYIDKKKNFFNKYCELLLTMQDYSSIGHITDIMATEFIFSSIPPYLSLKDIKHSVHAHNDKSVVMSDFIIEISTSIKLIRYNAIRLVLDPQIGYVLYYSTNNSLIYQEKDLNGLTIEDEDEPAIRFLIKEYPKFVKVGSIPMDYDENKITFCQTLYDEGLLLRK